MEYKFFNANKADMPPITKGFELLSNPRKMYDYMSKIWCEYSCAPRMRKDWSKDNMTLGQCSITSFLIQDIFGGEVYGVPLGDGSYHCYNVINGVQFDLTSEQFGNQNLIYDDKYPQSREEHFASREKYERYLYLKRTLINNLLIEKNQNFSSKNELSSLTKGQSPYMMVICCSDSRVVPEMVFNTSYNEMFVIRTAGNVINEGELASIEYGIGHLHIKYVLVLGHTSCGAIHASIHNEKGKYLDPILNRIKKNIENTKDELEASKINANKEKEYLMKMFPIDDVIFDSAIYDIGTGKIEFIK